MSNVRRVPSQAELTKCVREADRMTETKAQSPLNEWPTSSVVTGARSVLVLEHTFGDHDYINITFIDDTVSICP